MSVLEELRVKIRQHETTNAANHAVLPFGVAEIDQHLPEGGLKHGALHEVAGGGNGAMHGAAAILFAAGILARTKGHILWCIKQRDMFAPALAQVGIDTERVIFSEAGDEKSLLACMEEGLRHGGLAGVVGEVSQLSMLASRRLQLAAESTGTIGIAIWRWRRNANRDQWGQPTAARTSWRITTLPSPTRTTHGIDRAKWHIELLRCRGGELAQFQMEACDETGNLAVPSVLVNRPAIQTAGQYAIA